MTKVCSFRPLLLCRPFGILSAILTMLLVGSPAKASDVYDTATQQVTIPAVEVGDFTLDNVVARVTSIVSPPSGTSANGAVDSYNPSNQQLSVQSVNVNATTYYNVVVTLAPSSATIGAASGADTYADGQLTIQHIQIGQTIYSGVIVKVLGSQLASIGSGLPATTADTYSGGVLTIPVVTAFGRVYTDVMATVGIGDVLSVGSISVLVPNTTGLTQAAASAAITGAGLSVGTVTTQSSATVAAGLVISESPVAKSSVASGSAVNLVVSSGPLAATPVLSPAGGNFSVSQQVSISDATINARIYYTTDGTAPTSGSNQYAAALTISTTTTVKAIAIAAGYTNSAVASGTYVLAGGAATEAWVYFFGAQVDDGEGPSNLIFGADGNLYGTSNSGGIDNGGTIFRMTPAGTETVIYSFPFGVYTSSGLIIGHDGNFYGETTSGGPYATGSVFIVTPAGQVTDLYDFGSSQSADANFPANGLVQDSDGNFWGTSTADGGAPPTPKNSCSGSCGTVFRITPQGVESVVHYFGTGTDGVLPLGGLVQDSVGNFYGTTHDGGTANLGTVFQITPAGVETVIYSFSGGSDGGNPATALVLGNDGNFYGTTPLTVFRITPFGVLTTIYTFDPKIGDGAFPLGPLIVGNDGNFYGTTDIAGADTWGTVFKVTPGGVETVLYSFAGGTTDGAEPGKSLVQDSAGNLYGTTYIGGLPCQRPGDSRGCGTAFKLIP